ncbi:hypothetical protein BCV71DRAFT_235589 [Rhizopus microsporus]|uniref:Uncharacterized protein n=1 Tax=Rhizopus microsporus TaxID=58291 RepID=A0A1X0S073_RHIZD|nr:hypothetical protein BCV71DRAFT_235589 [Rhizopus microsporus]
MITEASLIDIQLTLSGYTVDQYLDLNLYYNINRKHVVCNSLYFRQDYSCSRVVRGKRFNIACAARSIYDIGFAFSKKEKVKCSISNVAVIYSESVGNTLILKKKVFYMRHIFGNALCINMTLYFNIFVLTEIPQYELQLLLAPYTPPVEYAFNNILY